MNLRDEYERLQSQAAHADYVAAVKRRNEGRHKCHGDHCGGWGRTLEAGEDCAFCQEVEYGIWQAGEPD